MPPLKIIFLPKFFKYIGLIVIVGGLFLFFTKLHFGYSISELIAFDTDVSVYAIYAIFIFGCTMITLSKETIEDEWINFLRVKSLLNSLLLHAAFFFVFTFTNLTIHLVNFPAIILMNTILIVYLMFFYIFKLIDYFKNKNVDSFD